MKRQLLVIDDNPMMGGLLSHHFSEEKKYEVMWCGNAQEAFTWLNGLHVPDLILCDVALNGMSGLEFLAEIKQTGFLKEIPVIMLAGRATDRLRKQCLKMGAAGFLAKPIDISSLQHKVNRLLNRAHRFSEY